jgi:hypothetical protein
MELISKITKNIQGESIAALGIVESEIRCFRWQFWPGWHAVYIAGFVRTRRGWNWFTAMEELPRTDKISVNIDTSRTNI